MVATACVAEAVVTMAMKCVADRWTVFTKATVPMSLSGVEAGPLAHDIGTTVGRHVVRPISSQDTEQDMACDALNTVVVFLWFGVHST